MDGGPFFFSIVATGFLSSLNAFFSFLFSLEVILLKLLVLVIHQCRNTTLAKCGGEAQHSQSWGLGVIRDS
jgi:hypothetical protein